MPASSSTTSTQRASIRPTALGLHGAGPRGCGTPVVQLVLLPAHVTAADEVVVEPPAPPREPHTAVAVRLTTRLNNREHQSAPRWSSSSESMAWGMCTRSFRVGSLHPSHLGGRP